MASQKYKKAKRKLGCNLVAAEDAPSPLSSRQADHVIGSAYADIAREVLAMAEATVGADHGDKSADEVVADFKRLINQRAKDGLEKMVNDLWPDKLPE